MFEDYMKFRQEMKVDKLIEEDWSRIGVFKSLYPRAFFNTDKEGRPVLIEKIGKAKFGRIFKVGTSLIYRSSIWNSSREC